MDANLIKELVEAGQPNFVKQSVKYAKDLSVHTYGERLMEFLAKINNYENETQAKLRKKFSISNKHIVGNLLNPSENIWMARGGSTHSDLSDSQKAQFTEALSELHEGNTFDEYMKGVYFDALVSDPNGLTFVYEVDRQPQIKPIASCDVLSYEMWGDGVKWILFEPEEDEKGIKFYTYIDAEVYQVYRFDGKDFTLYEDEPNVYGFVPVVFNGVYFGKANIREEKKEIIRLSPLDSSVQLLQAYVRKNSVKEIYENKHAFPKFWKYVNDCPRCTGYGTIDKDGEDVTCPTCNGAGFIDKSDVSDVYGLSLPKDGETKIAPDVMGFVQPDLETWREMRAELVWDFEEMFKAEWGTQYQKVGQETATGRFIDTQPVNARLNKYSTEIESVYNKIAGMVLKIMFPGSEPTYRKNFGKQFIIETPDQALKSYKESEGSPDIIRNVYIEQAILAEYKTDRLNAERKLNLMRVEPFLHYNFEDIKDIGLLPIDKLAKYYFNDWLLSEKDLDRSAESLRESLYKYVELKQLNDGTESTSTEGSGGEA